MSVYAAKLVSKMSTKTQVAWGSSGHEPAHVLGNGGPWKDCRNGSALQRDSIDSALPHVCLSKCYALPAHSVVDSRNPGHCKIGTPECLLASAAESEQASK